MYIFSIDDDILNLIDEVDLDKVLKEAAEAFVDDKKFLEYVREKSARAISRFLVRLPDVILIHALVPGRDTIYHSLAYANTIYYSLYSTGLFTQDIDSNRKTGDWRWLGNNVPW